MTTRPASASTAAHALDSVLYGDMFGSVEMRAVFTDEALVRRWLEVEAALARAQASVGLIPDVKRIAALLRAQAIAIRAEVEGLGDELCSSRPAEDEWCVNEVLGHIVEAERRGFNGRIRSILEQDKPALQAWDQAGVARERHDDERASLDVLREFEAVREDSVGLVAGLTPAQLQRSGQHPHVGELTVRDLLHEWLHHDRNHVKQILSNVQAYVWPRMGNARRFSEFD